MTGGDAAMAYFGEAGSATSSDCAFFVAGGFLSAASGGASATAGGANAVSGTMETLVPPTALAPHAAALGPPLAAERKPPATEKARSLLVADPASPKYAIAASPPVVC